MHAFLVLGVILGSEELVVFELNKKFPINAFFYSERQALYNVLSIIYLFIR